MTTALQHTINPGYIAYDLRRNLRMFSALFFIVLLPVAMYLIFGAMQDYSATELPHGRGNVSASIMISMAAYGAIQATSTQAGSAAVELQQGWGRQIGVTPFTRLGYVVSKTAVALVIAVLPIVAVFVVGALTSARMDGWIWVASGVIVLVSATVFALYGLAFGMLFRSEAAVSAASGMVVILMFLGNAFVPLSGFMLELAPFTPVWGVTQLALWPLHEGGALTGGDEIVEYALWQPIANVLVWGIVFGLLALWGSRRGTSRR